MSALLDKNFMEQHYVIPVPLELDKKGIDRVFVSRETFEPMTIEYKNDFRSAETGNAFIEICSVHKEECEKEGWVYTCEAEFLVYHDVGNKVAYIVDVENLQYKVDDWIRLYQEAKSFNPGYHSVGILVPMSEIKDIAIVTANVK
jgi:hypothetical protein